MQGAYEDKTLRCRECGVDFVWTAGEQAFYESRHLMNAPTRCPSCRAQARATREASGAPTVAGRRELFPAVCDRCGVQTQVPFMPRNDRPVYCSTCYDQVRAERVSYGTR